MIDENTLGKLCLLRNCIEVVVLSQVKKGLFLGTVYQLATGNKVTTHLWKADGTAVEMCIVEDATERDIIKVDPSRVDIHNARIEMLQQKVKELIEGEGFIPQFGSITLHDTFKAYLFKYNEPVRRILSFKQKELPEDEDDYFN